MPGLYDDVTTQKSIIFYNLMVWIIITLIPMLFPNYYHVYYTSHIQCYGRSMRQVPVITYII